jgi:hypothetical protein
MTTLKEIILRHRNASHGEWIATTPEDPSGCTVATTGKTWRESPSQRRSFVRCIGEGYTTDAQAEKDADFIAHAKTTDIPFLLSVIRTLKEEELVHFISSVPLSEESHKMALRVLDDLNDDLLPPPEIMPDQDDSVIFIWITPMSSLEIRVNSKCISWRTPNPHIYRSWNSIPVEEYNPQDLLIHMNKIIQDTP